MTPCSSFSGTWRVGLAPGKCREIRIRRLAFSSRRSPPNLRSSLASRARSNRNPVAENAPLARVNKATTTTTTMIQFSPVAPPSPFRRTRLCARDGKREGKSIGALSRRCFDNRRVLIDFFFFLSEGIQPKESKRPERF